jgi:hypothetical protein
MEVIHSTGRKRETYEVQFAFSPLWECALGIAAVTNSRLINTLEKSVTFWDELKGSLPKKLLSQLEFVEKNNTWKALLQLLHRFKTDNLNDFCLSIERLDESKLKFNCLPFIGEQFQHLRERAAAGERDALIKMKRLTNENPFFPQYIEFISLADANELKVHLIEVMTLWYEEVITPELELINQILSTDYKSKNQMKREISPEELVQWATGGVNYLPEPSVHNVLLIPQYVYRPWTIEADIENTKVFYYPISRCIWRLPCSRETRKGC